MFDHVNVITNISITLEGKPMKFEKRIFNAKAMATWLDDAVEVLGSEGLPMSCEAVKQMRIHVTELESIIKKIAGQKTTAEMDADEYNDADFEGGYVDIVLLARGKIK